MMPLKRIESIIHSMTPYERRNPIVLNGSRKKKRIADGSGTSVQDVNQLIKQFSQMGKMMKNDGRRSETNDANDEEVEVECQETDKINMIILDGKKTSNDIKDEITMK